MKTQSSELMRIAIEKSRNEQRHIDWLKRSAMYRYENKHELDVCEPWYSHIDGDTEYQAQFEEQSE